MNFKRVNSSEINPEKWNNCIQRMDRHSLYAQIWFLNLVCLKGWEVLIWDDYRAVFPIPISKKIFFSFLDNPNLLQQIDIYGSLSHEEKKELKEYLQQHFDYIVLSTSTPLFDNNLEKINLILQTVEYTKTKPSSTLRNNIKKATKNSLELFLDKKYEKGLEFLKQHFHLTGHVPNVKEWAFYETIMKECQNNGKARFQFVLKEGLPVQFAFWIVEQNTAYYLLNISSPEGRTVGASHFAIHQFIEENKSTVDLIDFEGSSIEGVKRFYKSFGATEETYYVYQENNLPFYLKWFKNF